MNFGDMQGRVQYTLGLSDIATTNETLLAQGWLNEGVVDVLARTRPYTRVIQLNVTANTPVHDLQNTVLALVDIQNPDNSSFLPRLSREDAVIAQQDGKPGFAFEEPLLWLSPVSSSDTFVQAYGVFRPAAMSQNTDDCSDPTHGGLPPEFHPAVINYALWKGGEYLQHEQSQGGERWRVLYEGQDGRGGDISRIKQILSKRVSPQGTQRRDLTRNLGALAPSGSYIGG